MTKLAAARRKVAIILYDATSQIADIDDVVENMEIRETTQPVARELTEGTAIDIKRVDNERVVAARAAVRRGAWFHVDREGMRAAPQLGQGQGSRQRTLPSMRSCPRSSWIAARKHVQRA